jgi:hypothetical protein
MVALERRIRNVNRLSIGAKIIPHHAIDFFVTVQIGIEFNAGIMWIGADRGMALGQRIHHPLPIAFGRIDQVVGVPT